jgi:ABC-type bacteriocin/lantibiotic exporter with double-glycine peptidase domain
MSSLPSSQPNGPRRRFLVPPVIQTSAMDCGPAALASLLDGFGIGISYGRLREACQTAVDGTSIDRLEMLAVSLGLDAEQIMLPVDHLLLPEAEALPAIVLVKTPSGLTHFVVAWRAHEAFVQVMDPARGRRWVRRASFLESVHRHEMAVPAGAFRDWAASAGFSGPLARRLRTLGVGDPDAQIARALEDPGWSAIAALDAAARTAAVLVGARALAHGPDAAKLVAALAVVAPAAGSGDVAQASSGPPPAAALSSHATARAAPPAPDGTPQIWLRGVVLLRVAGAARLDEAERAALPIELRAAVEGPRPRPGAALARLLARDGPWRWSVLGVGVLLMAVGAVAEGLLFQSLIDLGVGRGGGLLGAALPARARVGFGSGSGSVLVAMLGLLVALGAVELLLARGLGAAGTRLDGRLRWQLGRKIPRLADRYFQTRPVSDLAERAHQLHRLRELPALAAEIARTGLELVLTAGALAWLVSSGAPLVTVTVLAIALSMLVIPTLAAPFVAERDLQMRSHASALGRFYLDGLLGLVAARTHRAEPALAREHGDRLRPWTRAAHAALGGALLAETAQALVGLGLVVWLLARFFSARRAVDPGAALLVVYWSLLLPALGQQLGKLVQRIPAQRNLTVRLIEALEAPDETSDPLPAPSDHQGSFGSGFAGAAGAPAERGGISIQIDDLRVLAGGHSILEIDTLGIDPGEHVAIVGASGAGKSSLLGLLLGWYVPSAGTLRVDRAVLDGEGLRALRRQSAWVEPAVYLWNRSLAENLAYGLAEGSPSGPPAGLDGALDAADLTEAVGRLPEGLGTVLGEAGALVSGGEGQRVRFGRGLLRPGVRLAILDEPFRGLERAQRSALLLRARLRWSAATLLCVTHDIAETAGFPRVLVLDDGKIVEDGVPAALLARPGSHYSRLAEAEAQVAKAWWSGAVWRRMQMRDGRVVGGSS